VGWFLNRDNAIEWAAITEPIDMTTGVRMAPAAQ